MKTLVIIIFLTILISIGAVAYLTLSERESNSFENYQSVVESGLIARGWVPSFIPKSAYNINEHHRVDEPNIFVELNFSPKDIIFFEKACDLLKHNIYKCNNSGNPVIVKITNKNHVTIESI